MRPEECFERATGAGGRDLSAAVSVAASRGRTLLPALPAAIPQPGVHGLASDAGATLGRRSSRFDFDDAVCPVFVVADDSVAWRVSAPCVSLACAACPSLCAVVAV